MGLGLDAFYTDVYIKFIDKEHHIVPSLEINQHKLIGVDCPCCVKKYDINGEVYYVHNHFYAPLRPKNFMCSEGFSINID